MRLDTPEAARAVAAALGMGDVARFALRADLRMDAGGQPRAVVEVALDTEAFRRVVDALREAAWPEEPSSPSA